MSRPWMPFYVADYLADTGHLTTLQHGAYALLLLSYWKRGALPNDEQQLMQIARMTADEWRANRGVLSDFFENGWKNARMEKELAKAADISSKRRKAAEQMHSKSSANAEQEHTPSQPPSQSKLNKKVLSEVGNEEVKPRPPRHGAISANKQFVYFKRGTKEFEAYSQDFQEARGEEPAATSDGRWFKWLGETNFMSKGAA